MREPGLGSHGEAGAGHTSLTGLAVAWRGITLVTALGVAAFFLVALLEGSSADSAVESALHGLSIAAISVGSLAGVLAGGRRVFAAAGLPDTDRFVPAGAPEALRSFAERVAHSRRLAGAGVLALGLIVGLVAYQAGQGGSGSGGDDVAADRVEGAEVSRTFDDPSGRSSGSGRAAGDDGDSSDGSGGGDTDSRTEGSDDGDSGDDDGSDEGSTATTRPTAGSTGGTTTTTTPPTDDDPVDDPCDTIDTTEDTLLGGNDLVGGLLGGDLSDQCDEVSDTVDEVVDTVEDTVDEVVDTVDDTVDDVVDTVDDTTETVDDTVDDVVDTITSTTLLPGLGL